MAVLLGMHRIGTSPSILPVFVSALGIASSLVNSMNANRRVELGSVSVGWREREKLVEDWVCLGETCWMARRVGRVVEGSAHTHSYNINKY